jgi:hypothetical protein
MTVLALGAIGLRTLTSIPCFKLEDIDKFSAFSGLVLEAGVPV